MYTVHRLCTHLQTLQVSDAGAVRIHEGARIDLVDDRLLPPVSCWNVRARERNPRCDETRYMYKILYVLQHFVKANASRYWYKYYEFCIILLHVACSTDSKRDCVCNL